MNLATLNKMLYAFVDELIRFEENLTRLLIEVVPGLSDWLLEDWERVLGLPDICTPPGLTRDQRRVIAHAKYTARYTGLSNQFFIDLARAYGSEVTVIESPGGSPFRVNKNRVDRTPDRGIDGARLNSPALYHTFMVRINSTDPNRKTIRCVFNKLKPAHTVMVWVEI